MYLAYFVNKNTGELFLSGKPSNNPTGKGWVQISLEEFELYSKISQFKK